MYRERAKDVSGHLGHILRWWLFGQGISMLILGVGTTILLWILNIPLAFLLGLVTAFMTFIPILGPIIAGVPWFYRTWRDRLLPRPFIEE